MLQILLGKIGLPVLIAVLAEALESVDMPVTKGAAAALGKVDEAIRAGQISEEQIAEAHRHAEEMAKLQREENTASLSAINETMRAETTSSDAYVRRMRPTFGYFMAITWAAQMLGLAYIIVFETEKSVYVLNAMGSLSMIWAVGLSVLGIYVYKRSEEKKISPENEVIFWNKGKT
jgi:hypothetical protein